MHYHGKLVQQRTDTSDLMGQTVADVMLGDPKTLPASASVGQVRGLLDSQSVQMVLLVDGETFAGAITEIPLDAATDTPARDFVNPAAETISLDLPATVAMERIQENRHRRIVVLAADGTTLAGLLCLNARRTHFCATSTRPKT
jgi:CBS domain-containing protein